MYVGSLSEIVSNESAYEIARKVMTYPMSTGTRVGTAWRRKFANRDNKEMQERRKYHLAGTAAGMIGGGLIGGPIGAGIGALNGSNIGMFAKDIKDKFSNKKKRG